MCTPLLHIEVYTDANTDTDMDARNPHQRPSLGNDCRKIGDIANFMGICELCFMIGYNKTG